MGGWTLIRESGKQGSSGSIKREHYDNLDEAMNAMSKWRDKNINRGYSIAFLEGVKAP